jgi:hypothetical protein
MTRFQWHYDADLHTHFCIVAHMVTHVTQILNEDAYSIRILNVDGDVPTTLVTIDRVLGFTEAIALAEEMIRGAFSPTQRETLALSVLSLFAEVTWKVQESAKDKFDEYTLSVPHIGEMHVWERSAGYLWMVHCPAYTVQFSSGVADTLTSAKVAAVSALTSLYLTHTVQTDGNTEWNNHLKKRNATQPIG